MDKTIILRKKCQFKNFVKPNLLKVFDNFSLTKLVLSAIALVSISFILITIFSLFIKTDTNQVLKVLNHKSLYYALSITLFSIIISSITVFIFGISIAYFLYENKKKKTTKILEILINFPLVLPPSISGIALISTFGKLGILSFANFNIAFSFIAIVFVQVFVTLPIFVQIVKEGFNDINKSIIESAKVFGAGEKELVFNFFIPLSKKHVFTGMILSILRCAGEFGATIVFAGNVSGKTQTITTLIYSYTQTNIKTGIALSTIYIVMFLVPILLLKLKMGD